jgi:hypothetical protein
MRIELIDQNRTGLFPEHRELELSREALEPDDNARMGM